MKFHFNEPPIQGARGIHADSCSKGTGSKARVETYRTRHLPAWVGLASKDSWETKVNQCMKPRENRAAKREMGCPARARPRSRTKQATVLGTRAKKSRAPLDRLAPGVKLVPKRPVLRSRQDTPEALPPASSAGEARVEIGTKQKPRATPGIGTTRSERMLTSRDLGGDETDVDLPVVCKCKYGLVGNRVHVHGYQRPQCGLREGLIGGITGKHASRLGSARKWHLNEGRHGDVVGVLPGPEPDAMKVARPVLMNRGVYILPL